jgi:hypothetical protein
MYILLTVLIFLVCSSLLLFNSRKTLIIDPGFLHIAIVSIAIGCASLSYNYHFKNIDHYWVLWSVDGMIKKILYLNCLYAVIFTFFYLLLLKIFGSKVNAYFVYSRNISKYRLSNFVIIYIFVLMIYFSLDALSMNYIKPYWNNVVDLSLMIVLALLLNKVQSSNLIILFSIITSLFLMFVYYPILMGGEQYQVNKGGVMKLIVFVLVFIDITRRKKIFTTTKVLLGFLFLPIFLGSANFIESWVTGSIPNFRDFLLYVFSGYELRMMENQALILNDLNNGSLIELSGSTYINAIYEIIMPFKNLSLSPTNWLAIYVNEDPSSGYNFSFLAEGILNYGQKGVVIAALLASTILYLVRSTLRINWIMSPFLFASFLILPYYVYRSDLQYILKTIVMGIISFTIIIALYYLVNALMKPFIRKKVFKI